MGGCSKIPDWLAGKSNVKVAGLLVGPLYLLTSRCTLTLSLHRDRENSRLSVSLSSYKSCHEGSILGNLPTSKLPSRGVSFTGVGLLHSIYNKASLGGQSTNRNRLKSKADGILSLKTRGGLNMKK